MAEEIDRSKYENIGYSFFEFTADNVIKSGILIFTREDMPDVVGIVSAFKDSDPQPVMEQLYDLIARTIMKMSELSEDNKKRTISEIDQLLNTIKPEEDGTDTGTDTPNNTL